MYPRLKCEVVAVGDEVLSVGAGPAARPARGAGLGGGAAAGRAAH